MLLHFRSVADSDGVVTAVLGCCQGDRQHVAQGIAR